MTKAMDLPSPARKRRSSYDEGMNHGLVCGLIICILMDVIIVMGFFMMRGQ